MPIEHAHVEFVTVVDYVYIERKGWSSATKKPRLNGVGRVAYNDPCLTAANASAGAVSETTASPHVVFVVRPLPSC